MEQLFPVGMDLKTIYPENKIADEANNGFILNLIESLLIVIVIIFYRDGGLVPVCWSVVRCCSR